MSLRAALDGLLHDTQLYHTHPLMRMEYYGQSCKYKRCSPGSYEKYSLAVIEQCHDAPGPLLFTFLRITIIYMVQYNV